MIMVDLIRQKARGIYPGLVEIRRHLHRHPELSFQEHETANFIEGRLTELGIRFERIAGTGVLATIEGKKPGNKSIVLRGDIDALPIQEDTGLDFSSSNKGVMHACGHDVHTTCVFGAAMILKELKDEFEGTVKILFQPGEEKLPGGASKVLESGMLQKANPHAVFGQHVYPELESGKIGLRPGMYMASADEIYITVKGPGGHAALPDRTVDVINASAQLIQQLQQVVSRNAPPLIPSVLSFGFIEGRGATNIIPKEVKLEGTFRTFDENWRQKAHDRIKAIADGVAQSSGADFEVNIMKGYPYLKNNEHLTGLVKDKAIEYLGKENVVDLDMRMTSEDFAFYSHVFDSCFWRLGVREKGGEIKGLHTPGFTVDESAIEIGAGFMAYLAISQLTVDS